MRESFVTGAAFTQNLPGEEGGRWVLRVKTTEGKIDKPMPTMNVDPDFPALIGLELLYGRMFDYEYPQRSTTGAVVVNESAVKAFGWTRCTCRRRVICARRHERAANWA